MAKLSITLGNKNYSSWSLRGWLALRQTGQDFRETVIPLRRPDSKARIQKASPSGRVPVLRIVENGKTTTVWDSLAIAEALAERYPEAGLWPEDPAERALARAVSAEMHAGFGALRTFMPMDVTRRHGEMGAAVRETPDVARDIARIVEIWTDCRRRAGRRHGSFLFGGFTTADAAFAPVVSRFATYDVPLAGAAAAYRDAVLGTPAMRAWTKAAKAEPWIIEFPELRPFLAASRPPRRRRSSDR